MTDAVAAADTVPWLTGLLAPGGGIAPHRLIDLRKRLRPLGFTEVVGAVERMGAALGTAGAIQLYHHWITTQPPGAPHLFAAWFNLGVELGKAGDQAGAMDAYRNALELRPDFHGAAINLGLALESQGKTDNALALYQQTLQSDEARLALLNNRGRLLEQLGQLDAAEQTLRTSLLTDPQQPDVIQHWVHLRQKLCRWPVLTDELPGLSPADLLLNAGPLSVLALTDDIATQSEAGARFIRRKTTAVPQPLAPAAGYGHARLRIGYLSSDFCRHALSYLIAELFEHHDRTRFELFGYCNSPEDGSDIRARIIAAFDHFTVIRPLSDEAAARRIRDDEIDILVDLNGLTTGARVQLLRWKPAPVQATYLGYVGPVPLPELDYLFCDDIVIPPARAGAYTPRPLAIAANYQANDGKREIGPTTTRAAAGLPEDRFVLCCFSNHYKITEPMFDAWMEILRRADNTALWLVADDQWSSAALSERAALRGVDPARLLFAGRVSPADYMARLALPDLFLDTFPYNAGTVASDAIRMGLPLVTLSGQSFAARMAGRLLEAVGAEEGIASDIPGYIDIAVRLASDPGHYAAYKARFNAEAWRQGIGNIEAFTATFERALLGVAK